MPPPYMMSRENKKKKKREPFLMSHLLQILNLSEGFFLVNKNHIVGNPFERKKISLLNFFLSFSFSQIYPYLSITTAII